MHRLDFPAGSTIRLTATARPDVGVHRWDIRIHAAGDAAADLAPMLAYGSRIGGRDCAQRVDIPAQDTDCRLEVWSRRAHAGGWEDSRCAVDEDTPSRLLLGFSSPASPTGCTDDVSLSFAFEAADRHP